MKTWLNQSYYGQADRHVDIPDRVGYLLSDLALDHFSYMILKAPAKLSMDVTETIQTSYPDEWTKRYMSKQYYQLDPVADLVEQSTMPFYWGQGRFLRKFRKPQRLVFDEAREFQIMHGLSVPVRGPAGEVAVFNVVSSDKRHLRDVTRGEHERIFRAAYDTHAVTMEKYRETECEEERGTVSLSPREKECLIWTLEGKTAGEIATILNLSVSTVNHHASTATRKLGALNKYHAAIQALRLGVIS
ncbi:MAG: LuxR family transcriptional regulator [Sneathiella sp.]